jgi:hypothetical protein
VILSTLYLVGAENTNTHIRTIVVSYGGELTCVLILQLRNCVDEGMLCFLESISSYFVVD